MFKKLLAAILMVASSAAIAQESSKTILVLDGSGSMWGQIDGKAKITIAQDVVENLLLTLSPERELGLTVYGHRRKGDCTDIQTLVEPALDTRSAIKDAVNAIKPKGKTPMTDAVIAAAKQLRYEEDKATVILVSDGVETCHPDPCEAARILEETGVDFTAHVVGFSINDPNAIAQMQCMAEETGGTFRTASNAAELTEALKVVAEPEPEPKPVPDPVTVKIHAIDGKHGPRITDNLVWDLQGNDTGILDAEMAPSLSLDLMPGEYVASVLRPSDEASADIRFGVGSEDKIVILELPEFKPPATLEAPDTAVAGSTIQVRWTGPDQQGDLISVTTPGRRSHHMVNYSYTKEGRLLELQMPPAEGDFEIRYVLSNGRKILAQRPIKVTPATATLEPPASLPAGATVQVGWTGPDYIRDFIAVTKPGEDKYGNYSYTKNGSPLDLELPADPGEYDLVYIMSQNRTIIARTRIVVTGVTYSVSAPASATAGSTVQVDWTGPDYNSDVISVAEVGTRGSKMLSYTYTKTGSPLGLKLPLKPGRYEIRYVLGQGREITAKTEIDVTEVSATVSAPAMANVGSSIQVTWDGPNYKSDFIGIVKTGDKETKYTKYTYTKEGSPLELEMPAYPGDYKVSYFASGPPRKVLASTPITLNEVSASLTAPATAMAGGTIDVTWEGPGYRRDFIAIGEVGKNYKTYTYVKEGSPLTVNVPKKAGAYEIRYILSVDRRVVAAVPLTVQ